MGANPNHCSTQITKLHRPYLVLCDIAQPAVRGSAFGGSCKNPECLWVRFSPPGFSTTHTHKGKRCECKQSIRPVLCQLQCDIFIVLSHTSQEVSAGHHNVLTVPVCTKHTHLCTSLYTNIHKQANIYMCQFEHTLWSSVLLCTVAPSQDLWQFWLHIQLLQQGVQSIERCISLLYSSCWKETRTTSSQTSIAVRHIWRCCCVLLGDFMYSLWTAAQLKPPPPPPEQASGTHWCEQIGFRLRSHPAVPFSQIQRRIRQG